MPSSPHPFCGAVISALIYLSPSPANAFESASLPHPLGRIARVFTPQQVPPKDPISSLKYRLSSLAQDQTHPIATALMTANPKIAVWAENQNITGSRGVTHSLPNHRPQPGSAVGIYTTKKSISPAITSLSPLAELDSIQQALSRLIPTQEHAHSPTEFNAICGSSLILGLSMLIPALLFKRQRLRSEDQLGQIRQRIAADLHDDIGSNLGSISLIARSAREDLVSHGDSAALAQDLREVESIARESSLAIHDIVWLLEQRQDSIGDLVQRMRETAGRLLREIHYTLECDSNKISAKLSLDAKRHLFLFYKEAIHNILKHSQANHVSIRLWDQDDQLALEILDNGIGLPLNAELSPQTVHKLKDRARVLEGQFQIHSSDQIGTQIRLLVKRSQLITQPTFA